MDNRELVGVILATACIAFAAGAAFGIILAETKELWQLF